MRTSHSIVVAAAGVTLGLLLGSARAQTELTAKGLDSGGGRITVGAVTIDGSVGGIAGISTNAGAATQAKSGYAGQLYDLVSLQVTASPTSITEYATSQLDASGIFDDDTTGLLGGTASWSVVAGPLASISASGLATPTNVYENTLASGRATFDGCTGTVVILVVDSNPDDYGLYAADGLPDGWQVGYFGIGNADAAPGANPDSDAMANLAEFLADTNPTNGASILMVTNIASGPVGNTIYWRGGVLATQYVDRCTNLLDEPVQWVTVFTNVPPTSILTNFLDSSTNNVLCFYRIRAAR